MQALQFMIGAGGFALAGGAMAYYDWARARAGRPLMGGRDTAQLYWIIYLALFTLALACVAAAIIR